MQQIGFSHIIGLCSDIDREMMIWTKFLIWMLTDTVMIEPELVQINLHIWRLL